jgi:hypothetical protein
MMPTGDFWAWFAPTLLAAVFAARYTTKLIAIVPRWRIAVFDGEASLEDQMMAGWFIFTMLYFIAIHLLLNEVFYHYHLIALPATLVAGSLFFPRLHPHIICTIYFIASVLSVQLVYL